MTTILKPSEVIIASFSKGFPQFIETVNYYRQIVNNTLSEEYNIYADEITISLHRGTNSSEVFIACTRIIAFELIEQGYQVSAGYYVPLTDDYLRRLNVTVMPKLLPTA